MPSWREGCGGEKVKHGPVEGGEGREEEERSSRTALRAWRERARSSEAIELASPTMPS
jgi:hypothetical protein